MIITNLGEIFEIITLIIITPAFIIFMNKLVKEYEKRENLERKLTELKIKDTKLNIESSEKILKVFKGDNKK